MISQGCKFVIALAGLMVLARLLDREDFGLMAMVVAVTGFLLLFKDLGLAMATIQRPEITHEQISTLFWINVGVSVVITGITAALAPVVAWFYGEPRLLNVMFVLSGAFLFGGVSVQHLALLRRQMRFGAVAVVEIVAQLLSVLAAVTLAWYFRTYWALVAMYVVLPATTAVGVWIACRWRPGRPVRGSGVRPMLFFGGYQTGFSVVNYFARNLDNALIGWRWGAEVLGVYREAYRLLLLPIEQITSPTTHIALATLSRLQAQPERFKAYYCRGIELMVTCGMPIVAFLFVSADTVVLTVLGAKWLDAVLIFRVLAPAAFLGTFNVASGWVYIALGRTDRQFRWGLFASIIFAIGFLIGLQWGSVGVAAAVSIITCALYIPSLLYAYHGTPLRLRDLGSVLWRPAVTAISAGAGLFAIRSAYQPDLPVGVRLVYEGVLYGAVFVLIWLILPGGRKSMKGILRLVREVRNSSAAVDQQNDANVDQQRE